MIFLQNLYTVRARNVKLGQNVPIKKTFIMPKSFKITFGFKIPHTGDKASLDRCGK